MRPVHPHARGEHISTQFHVASFTGSSPRPWGTPPKTLSSIFTIRFIPTPVGNTSHSTTSPGFKTVHPHARGEHFGINPFAMISAGSSPRPWGTQRRGGQDHALPGFIPTPVGNTWPGWARTGRPPVHPHARGEHVSPGIYKNIDDGSSPRPWGTRQEPEYFQSLFRFIPTPVGNTLILSPYK